MRAGIYSILLAIALLWVQDCWATHNRAGEITYKYAPLSGQQFRYEFTITTYTKTGGLSEEADRDSLEIFWGDGTSKYLQRINGNGELLPNAIKKNSYRGTHSYPGAFPFYVVSVEDPNRIDNIVNINDGNSVNVPFYIEDTLFLLNPQFFGYNKSPELFQPPIDYANVNYTFVHNPNAFDEDGDSLHFELIPPKTVQNTVVIDVPLYKDPDEVMPGAGNLMTLDSNTGEFIWQTPQRAGIYNIAFLIREFRNGVQIGNMIRDMQIIVEELPNLPPEVEALKDTCIEAGSSFAIVVDAFDEDSPPQELTLSAFGGPLELENSPATFTFNNNIPGTATGFFNWSTTCDHIFSDEYIVVFKVEDDFIDFSVSPPTPKPLVDLETWLISVVPPAPTGLAASIANSQILLTWDETYPCYNNDKFLGFSIWRSVGCDTLDFDVCTEGLSGTNYQKLAERVFDFNYTDDTAVKGIFYTYRITAEFADVTTSNGFPINVSESSPSNNACIELPRDIPVILNVSVLSTDANIGEMQVRWSKPRAEDLDTIANPPPYRYELLRSLGKLGDSPALVASFETPSFSLANDTSFIDAGLNTAGTDYSYQIEFFSNGNSLGTTRVASSIFIQSAPSDNEMELSWDENVPWTNLEYEVYRKNSLGVFELIGVTPNQFYRDTDLTNGTQYCYFITGKGTYFTTDLPDLLLNDSQERCDIPIDTEPPCPPVLLVENDCDEGLEEWTEENYKNTLLWTDPNLSCADDVVAYNIYYEPPLEEEYFVLDSLQGHSSTVYDHYVSGSLAGCYYVTAIDSFQNESLSSNTVCIENCPIYNLPNTFTPNQDGANDFFIPLAGYRFVERIDLKVYNRWGNLVFETNDPEIGWDGTDNSSGKQLSEGVYYYDCDVYEKTSQGREVLMDSFAGFIHLFR